MKKILLSVIMLSLCGWLQAQTLKGKVVDENGKALAGASIKLNDQASAISDENGVFTMDCSQSGTVSVSFVGYETQSQKIENCDTELSFKMVSDSKMLDEVEITATSNQNKHMLNQASSISKLGDVEIKRGQGLFMDDAINANVPGVFMQRRTVSAGQQFIIRGYGAGLGARGANSNFDSQGIKVYLNGIPITDAEGITLMDDIDFGSIGNVEIVKGPSGTLYGLAVSGVVNLQTVKAAPNKTSVSQNTMLGSYGLRRSTTTIQIGKPGTSFLINYGMQHYDGFMVHTNSRKNFMNMMGEFKLNDKQQITSYLGFSDSNDQRNGELSTTQYYSNDYSGNTAYLKNDAHSNVMSFRAGLGHTYKFNDQISNTTTIFGTGVSNNSSSAAGWTDKAPVNFGIRSVVDAKFNLGADMFLSGVTGVEAQQQNAQIISYAMVPNAVNPKSPYNIIGAMRSNQSSQTSTYSLFTQWTLTLPLAITVTAGLGSSTMNITLIDKFYVAANNVSGNQIPTKYVSDYRNLISPSFAVNKLVTKNFSVYASYNKGYKAPVASNIYTPAANSVNTSLRPEVGEQIEFGSKGNLLNGKLIYELAYFMTKYSDKMTTVAVPNATNTATAYTYTVNSGNLDNKGLEVLVRYNAYESDGIIKSVRPFANFTYSDFKYNKFVYQGSTGAAPVGTPTDYTGKAVAGVPKNVYNAGFDIMTKFGVYLNGTYMHRDAMPVVSDGSIKTSDYDLLNSKIGFRKSLGHFDVDAYFGANNLANKQYYQMVFINQQPDTYLPGPRWVNYYGGLNLKYTF